MEKEVRLTIDRVPQELKRRFKAWCIMNGTNMRNELVKHIEQTVGKGKKK